MDRNGGIQEARRLDRIDAEASVKAWRGPRSSRGREEMGPVKDTRISLCSVQQTSPRQPNEKKSEH